ncbi:MAG: hypothetical protein GZ088_09590 [Acidipila sp.]|nr:hypothetical protein [Acidipila sp.]
MAKRTDNDRAATFATLELKFNTFLMLRIFVGMHMHFPREQFDVVVNDLFATFVQRRKEAIALVVSAEKEKAAPSTENAELHRWRLNQLEALEALVIDLKRQVADLRDSCTPPPAGS